MKTYAINQIEYGIFNYISMDIGLEKLDKYTKNPGKKYVDLTLYGIVEYIKILKNE